MSDNSSSNDVDPDNNINKTKKGGDLDSEFFHRSKCIKDWSDVASSKQGDSIFNFADELLLSNQDFEISE